MAGGVRLPCRPPRRPTDRGHESLHSNRHVPDAPDARPRRPPVCSGSPPAWPHRPGRRISRAVRLRIPGAAPLRRVMIVDAPGGANGGKDMLMNGPESFDRDAAQRAQQRLERRSKRRLVKHLLERNAQWRRFVARAMAAGLAATVAGHLVFGEVAVAAPAAAPATGARA